MGIVENTYAELKQQELKNNPYSCLHMADIDINPHQIEAFTFALSSLELGGAILADEVGLGKTIEAGLVIKYLLCSGKNKILLIMPSNLRKQWQVELEEKHILEDEKEARDYIIQAWAEAMELYGSGQHELKLSKDTENYLRQMQKEFMPEDAKVGIIQLWLDELSQDYVCSIMIYKEAFDHEYDTPKDWELKEINNVMNNSIFGWEKISSHRFAEYGIQRGWRRIVDKEEFHKLPEHAETPFDEK